MKTVLIRESKGDMEEIELDIHPRKYEIFKLLGGSGTFVGQFPETDVVIMKGVNHTKENENSLGEPFHEETIQGPILLIRMDENADHQDLTLQECITKKYLSSNQ